MKQCVAKRTIITHDFSRGPVDETQDTEGIIVVGNVFALKSYYCRKRSDGAEPTMEILDEHYRDGDGGYAPMRVTVDFFRKNFVAL